MLRERIESASGDLIRGMPKTFAAAFLAAEAGHAVCDALYGERSDKASAW